MWNYSLVSLVITIWLPILIPRATHEGNKYNHELKAYIWLILTLARIPQRKKKSICCPFCLTCFRCCRDNIGVKEAHTVLFCFVLFDVDQNLRTMQMLNYVTQGIWHHSICLLHGFQLKVCRLYLLSKRSRKCSWPKAVLGTVLQKTCYSWVNWKRASSEELLGNFDFRTEDVVTELFEETKTARGNTPVPTKRISERGEKEETKRLISLTEALFLTLTRPLHLN